MTSLLKLFGGGRNKASKAPPIADAVAGIGIPVYGLESEIFDLHFREFTYSPDEVELVFQRGGPSDMRPGIRIRSRRTAGNEPERFVDMLVRAAAQAAALDFGGERTRAAAQPYLRDKNNPFAMLEQYTLSGSNESVVLGDAFQASVLIWQWKAPHPLRAAALRERDPIVVASYGLETDQLLECLRSVVPVNERSGLIEAYQAAFDKQRQSLRGA